jgi:hypothetical protein
MTLQITEKQRALLLDALTTRMQRIEKMVKIYDEDEKMELVYTQEYLDVESLRQIVVNTNNI